MDEDGKLFLGSAVAGNWDIEEGGCPTIAEDVEHGEYYERGGHTRLSNWHHFILAIWNNIVHDDGGGNNVTVLTQG